MRDAGRQLADRGHFFRLQQLVMRILQFLDENPLFFLLMLKRYQRALALLHFDLHLRLGVVQRTIDFFVLVQGFFKRFCALADLALQHQRRLEHAEIGVLIARAAFCAIHQCRDDLVQARNLVA